MVIFVVANGIKRRYTIKTLLGNSHFKQKENTDMKRFNPKSKTFKVFTALYNGKALTPSQAKHDLGVGNLAAEASRIRQAGYAVYTNSRTAGNGVQVTEYVMGKPSRKLIAAGYKAMALGLVD